VRVLFMAVVAMTAIGAGARVAQADEIILKNGLRLKCTILSEDIDTISVSFPSGKKNKYLRTEITGARRELTPVLKAIEQKLKEKKTDGALALCEEVANDPQQLSWQREFALLKEIEIDCATGKMSEAVAVYFRLLEAFPRTMHFAEFPLPRDADEAKRIEKWLDDHDQDQIDPFAEGVAQGLRLICRFVAEEPLSGDIAKTLEKSPDWRLAGLGAIATAIRVCATDKVEGQRALENCARTLRVPFLPITYTLLGVARMRDGKWQDALAAFLRQPILFPENRPAMVVSLFWAQRCLDYVRNLKLLTNVVKMQAREFGYAGKSGK